MEWKKAPLLILLLLFPAWSTFSYGHPVADSSDHQSLDILVVSPGTDIGPWNLEISRALMKELHPEIQKPVNIYNYQMNWNIFPNRDAYREHMALHLRQYYDHHGIDYVVSLWEALGMISDSRALEDIPVVATSVDSSMFKQEILQNERYYIAWKVLDFSRTLELALELLPQTEEVYVIGGVSNFDRFIVNRTRSQLKEYQDRLSIHYWDSLSVQVIEQNITDLPDNAIVLFLTINEDVTGSKYIPKDVLPRITQASNRPVFGVLHTYLDNGIIGGYMDDSRIAGKTAANIIRNLENGKPVERTRRLMDYGNYLVDWNQMQK